MVSESKILTVSYGTFSCTLEGFDDPFSTMRSIAEYFRDLAAGDRYFGAEPPTPDAEMLHRIAEREIQHKVEARVEDDNIVLRQANAQAPEGKATMVAGEALLAQPEALVEETTPEAPVAKEDTVLAEVQDAQDTSESKQADAVVEAVVQAPVEAPKDAVLTKDTADEMFSDEDYSAVEDFDDETLVEDVPEDVNEETVADVTPSADLSDTSIAAKLRRIRAVVDTRGDDKSREDNETGLADDFYAEALGLEKDQPTADYSENQADAAWDASDENTDEAPAEDGAEDRENDSILSGISAALAQDDTDAVENLQETEITSDFASKVADLNADDTAEDLIDFAGEYTDDEEGDQDSDDGDDEDENVFAEDAAEAPIAVARIVKVRRAKPDATDAQDAEDFGESNSMLTPEEEASLMAELAEVERDAGQDADFEDDVELETVTDTSPEDDSEKPSVSSLGRTAFDDGDYAGTDAMDRIMDETNAKLDSDEVNQKQSSIAHLRRAVQAKRADTNDGYDDAHEDVADEYRNDLARVVRPRRLGAGQSSGARRLAPLVLVSEQRVNEPEIEAPAADQAPVQPRRIVKSDSDVSGDDLGSESKHHDIITDFRAFATDMGADGPAELLEAAAAFRTFIKGQETFSRPQVMNLMMKSDADGALSREEGLRAFGTLIREGVINKIQRGRYSVSENTRFRPDPERARA